MSFRFDLSKISPINVLCVGVSCAALLYSRWSNKRLEKVCDNLDRAVDDLVDKDLNIDISHEIVESVVERQVSAFVNSTMPTYVANARTEAVKSFKAEVQREINAQYNDIKSEVRREVADKVKHIDINDIKKQVIADAKQEAANRFHDELDDVLSKFNRQLEDVGTIYSSIADKMKNS